MVVPDDLQTIRGFLPSERKNEKVRQFSGFLIFRVAVALDLRCIPRVGFRIICLSVILSSGRDCGGKLGTVYV